MDAETHGERIYREKAPDAVSWYRAHLEKSLEFIEQLASDRCSSIIDPGGGATFVDDLVARRYRNVSVLHISQTAIDANRKHLGNLAYAVRWLVADVTRSELEPSAITRLMMEWGRVIENSQPPCR